MKVVRSDHASANQRLMSSASISKVSIDGPLDSMPPGPSESVLAQTIRFRLGRQHYLPEMHERFGDVVTLRVVPGGPFVILRNPDHIKEVFKGAPEIFHAGEGNSLLVPIVGRNSVLTLDAPDHKPARKRMMPPFQHERIAALSSVVREITENEVRSWPVGKPFRLLDRSYALTLDIIVRAVLGVEDKHRAAELGRVLRRVSDIGLSDILVWIRPQLGSVWPWRNVVRNLDRADELIYAEIARRRQDPNRSSRTDALSIMLDGEPEDEIVRDELMALLMAGHETTAVAISWVFERLLRHPEVLARVRRNLHEPKDPYRTAVFKEALRVRPVIHNVARRLTEPIELAGYRLPAGVAVLPSIGAVQSDPRFWGADAKEFRPERWLEPNPPLHAWLPFGGGVRRCIGAMFAQVEVEAVMTEVLRSVHIEAVDLDDEGSEMRNITMIPKQGARVRVVRRLGS
ncbi:cytochrome P450 [Umezawaea sp. Da 62-37]|uniref:cytochrome P450 n=1 Tax=Umezawaea sp. Da 62-37 TaxID=3075927 RepID=UPI0028F6E3AD|nr:cytochrome P450 [Umezawaea sp. Da 62-37]WNV85257.1 cytochrome P450 [Umezawaea sp. Da 62-37]